MLVALMVKVRFSSFFKLILKADIISEFDALLISREKPYSSFGAALLLMAKIVCLLFLQPTLFNKPAVQTLAEMYPQVDLANPRCGDLVRILIQTLWIISVKPQKKMLLQKERVILNKCKSLFKLLLQLPIFLTRQFVSLIKKQTVQPKISAAKNQFLNKATGRVLMMVIILGAVICITVPFNGTAQITFIILLFSLAMLVRRIEGRLPNMVLLILSIIASSRYLWWRYTQTLNWDNNLDLLLGMILLAAETYGWVVLVLGYFQNIWPLQRKPEQLPPDTNLWPTIDLFIPTYNEELDVIRPTVIAALGIDWPKRKINIFILDDGKRDNIQAFAEQIGVGYIRRPTNEHAKAGNINYALKQTSGEYVAIFDCDHIPARSFFQMTMGAFFKDAKLALVQTPHHFYSPDPFERNLGHFGEVPNEDKLFYGLIQDGNDLWGATFFCGSCAILNRAALNEVGGIAVETVTEDAHTALKLHRLGYTSAYLRVPISAGLATETLSVYIGQRIRWARGMAQILRLDNPLLGKGLHWQQRLCYFNGMLHFLSGIPRIIFLLAPLAYLILGAHIIYAPAVAILLNVLPHLIHSNIATSKIQGEYRHNFWGEVYETVLAWYIAKPTLVALLSPHIGKFNVTSKGGLIHDDYLDWAISKPYMVLIVLNLIGVLFGCYSLLTGTINEIGTIIFNLCWTFYNLLLLGGAMGVAAETKQIRANHRIKVNTQIIIRTASSHLYPAVMTDFSIGGIRIELQDGSICKLQDKVQVTLHKASQEFTFDCHVTFLNRNIIGLKLQEMSKEKQIEYVQCTFAKADSWSMSSAGYTQNKPLDSLKSVLLVGVKGYYRLFDLSPEIIKKQFKYLSRIGLFIESYLPRSVQLRNAC